MQRRLHVLRVSAPRKHPPPVAVGRATSSNGVGWGFFHDEEEGILATLVGASTDTVLVVAAIPDLDLDEIRTYAAGRVRAHLHDQIQMEVDVRGATATIVQCRPPWPGGSGTEWTREGVARMKYRAATNDWVLYWSDANSKWHRFDLIEPGSIEEILDGIEEDPTFIFWG